MPDKFMKEIEEILKQAEDIVRKEPTRKGQRRSSPHQSSPLKSKRTGIRFSLPSPGKLMLAGVAIFLVALILNATVHGGVALLIWAGIALFVLAYALYFIRPGGSKYEKRWRGRPVEDTGTSSLVDRLKRWFQGRQRSKN